MNVAGVPSHSKGSEKSDDRNGIDRVKEVRLRLRLNLFHHLEYVA